MTGRPLDRSDPSPDELVPTPAAKSSHGKPKHRLPTRVWHRLGVGGLALVIVTVAAAGGLVGYARWRFDQVKKVQLTNLRPPSPGVAPGKTTPENILIVGNGTRALSPGDAKFFGSTADEGGNLSDVTMILHLDPATGQASLLSIPRDLFVALPPHSSAGPYSKINAALADGPDNLIATITNDLGIPIDHYVEVNFDGFQNVIDALGGIRLYFPYKLLDPNAGLNITTTGCQQLDGFQALAVVRSRELQYFANGKWNYDPLSDLGRIRRNQTFLKVLVHTVKAKGYDNPIRAQAVLGAIVHDITIDSGMSETALLSLGNRFRNLDPSSVPTVTLPITSVDNFHYAGGSYGSVLLASEPQDQATIATFLGSLAPSTNAGIGATVDVEDISGVANHGATIAHQLSAVGFQVGTTTTKPFTGEPLVTLVRYPPGALAQAQGVLAALQGAAILSQDATVAAGHVVVQAGSVLAVAPPAAPPAVTPTVTPSVTPTATPSATPTATPSASATPAVPTPGGQAVTPQSYPPQPFDPTACPGD